MNRVIASQIISVAGVLLLVVAMIHLLVTPALRQAILVRTLTPQQLQIISPPFLLNHIVVGILLIPLGFSTLYSAQGIRAGERWAWIISLANGLTILILPLVLALLMSGRDFRALPFLVAASLICVVGITMTVVLVLVRRDFMKQVRH